MRWMVLVHRWLGVGLCLLFVAWFASGLVMMYVPFPSLPQAAQLAQAPDLDLSDFGMASQTEVFAAFEPGTLDRVRWVASPRSEPLLVVESVTGAATVYRADTQQPFQALTSSDAQRAAERFSEMAADRVVGPFDYDQWVVHQAFDRYRPYFRVDFRDPDRTSLYVSRATGEIVQRTTRAERGWNYVGAVVHWIYPTVIRKNWALWDRLVWWLSLLGIAATGLGLTLGVVWLRRTRGRGRVSPFSGWLGWHHKLGLIAAAFVFTWIFSGWLSMDHGRLFSMPGPTQQRLEAFRGLDFHGAVAGIVSRPVTPPSSLKELEVSAIAGLPMLVARSTDGSSAWVYERGSGPRPLGRRDIEAAIRAAWPDRQILTSDRVADDDAYAHLREGSLGRNVLRVVMDDPHGTWVHVDLDTGRIVSVMDRSRRVYRWLFNGLHSLDFPGLVDRRPLWDALMLALLLGGLAFSATSAVIAYRRVIRQVDRVK